MYKIYSVVKYKEDEEVTNEIFDNEKEALHHIKFFDENKENPLDVCGLDLIAISMDGHEMGDPKYSIKVEPQLYDVTKYD